MLRSRRFSDQTDASSDSSMASEAWSVWAQRNDRPASADTFVPGDADLAGEAAPLGPTPASGYEHELLSRNVAVETSAHRNSGEEPRSPTAPQPPSTVHARRSACDQLRLEDDRALLDCFPADLAEQEINRGHTKALPGAPDGAEGNY